MSETEYAKNNVTLEVIIPESSAAGDTVTIHCPDNTFVEFVTPENIAPGETVHVVVGDAEHATMSQDVVSNGNSYGGVAAVTTVRIYGIDGNYYYYLLQFKIYVSNSYREL